MKLEPWVKFILQHRGSRIDELATVLDKTEKEIASVRSTRAASGSGKPKRFAELFVLWHGRTPVLWHGRTPLDNEWPKPRYRPKLRSYEWQSPETAMVAALVGRVGLRDVTEILTKRLQEITGDPAAKRTINSVQCALTRIGLTTTDVVGGITVTEAGREIGSVAIIYQAISSKTLRVFRVGRLYVIPHDEWARWKAARTPPPKGYVPLSSIRLPLGFSSDSKLPEYASMGCIPTAILCSNPHTPGVKAGGRGSWYLDAKVARRIIGDRRAGRPMPWHGLPLKENLKKTYALWLERRHPPECQECTAIWGKCAPVSLAEYTTRYAALTMGAKRHLTRVWSPGLTIGEVATKCNVKWDRVRRATDNGTLPSSLYRGRRRINRVDAARWKGRNCPTGESRQSWLALTTARKVYGFSFPEMRRFVRSGKLRSRVGTNGAERGITYVAKMQLAMLREQVGYTLLQAARRVGVSEPKMLALLGDANWRGTTGIPMATIMTVKNRLTYTDREGVTIETAASTLRVTVEWIRDRIKDGTIRMMRSSRDKRRTYITSAMMRRLREVRARRRALPREKFGPLWLNRSEAALDAGVSMTTILRWQEAGELETRPDVGGQRFHRRSVRAIARHYWTRGWGTRFRRKLRPAWLVRA